MHVLQEVLTAPDRALTQQPGYMQRLGAFTGASRVKRLALKLMVAAAVTTPGVLQSSELQRLRVRTLGLALGQYIWGAGAAFAAGHWQLQWDCVRWGLLSCVSNAVIPGHQF